ncbi:MAG: aminotransferase class I/II-fold pyridoxal phosphate-dependent enzyme [Pseudomonadota bacterium]|nr:aminotransferase class I/II-fold pyridoxal phosphate-dependent enzyme [Pseudomonadota bacterium]
MPGYELIDNKEFLAIKKIFDNGGILFAHGFDKIRKNYHVREFENSSKKFFKSNYALAVSSGTAAIKIGLKALGVKRGDEVITQAFNFIATIEAIIDCGAKPILVNIDKTLNMDVNELRKKITKKTKVIIPVHMLGYPCDMKSIKKISREKKIKILEDNCESVGGSYNGNLLGNTSDIGVLSFDFGKTLTTGEGGMILTNNEKYFNYCKQYHDHGHKNIKNLSRGNDKASIAGFNYRMTELQGAIGKEQLKKLNILLKDNKKKYYTLKKNIKKFEKRKMTYKGISNYDNYIFFVNNKSQKKKILETLRKFKISTKNLPDAIKWHCAFYWRHIFNSKDIVSTKKTKKLLDDAIAIPIFYRKNLNFYTTLAKKINKIQ